MEPLINQFERLKSTLPGDAEVLRERNAALAAFTAHGLPKRHHENWRYTDLSAINLADLQCALPSTDDAPLLPTSEFTNGTYATFIDGRYQPSASNVANASTSAVTLLLDDWSAVTAGSLNPARHGHHPLAMLNTAFTQHGLLIRVPPEMDVRGPIRIQLFHTSLDAVVIQPRIVVELAENSSAEIIIETKALNGAAFGNNGGGESWTNVVTDVTLARGANLSFTQIQAAGSKHTHTALISAELSRDATLNAGFFDVGARLARNDIDIRLGGIGAHANLYGAFLAVDHQYADNHIVVDHAAGQTTSMQDFRGIAGIRSRGVFNGKVIVRQDSQKISADQRNDNLLLDPTAEIDTKPELEIYADDVKCSHGATVGELDETHLFYLQSRGINLEAARALLTFAFATTVIRHVRDQTLREDLTQRIAAQLPNHERWEKLA